MVGRKIRRKASSPGKALGELGVPDLVQQQVSGDVHAVHHRLGVEDDQVDGEGLGDAKGHGVVGVDDWSVGATEEISESRLQGVSDLVTFLHFALHLYGG